jgi:hypothetical protein
MDLAIATPEAVGTNKQNQIGMSSMKAGLWANKCKGKHAEKNSIISKVRLHLNKLGPSQ